MNVEAIKVGMSWKLTRDGAGDKRILTITLPIATKSLSNQRWHWAQRSRAAKAQRGPTSLVVRSAMAAEPIGLPCVVKLTRIAPRALDDDNLRGALKSVRDGVADAFGLDDRDPKLSWEYGQRKGAVRENAVEIRVERR